MKNLKPYIKKDETILWEGQPSKNGRFWDAALNPLAPFAFLWAVIDFGVLGRIFGNSSFGMSGMGFFIIPFFALHLMPVWIYLGGIIKSLKRDSETEYVLTDKSVYVYDGKSVQTISLSEARNITLNRGFVDKRANTGDILLSTKNYKNGVNIRNIEDYSMIFNRINELRSDSAAFSKIRTDNSETAETSTEEQYSSAYSTITNYRPNRTEIDESASDDFIAAERAGEKKTTFKEEEW